MTPVKVGCLVVAVAAALAGQEVRRVAAAPVERRVIVNTTGGVRAALARSLDLEIVGQDGRRAYGYVDTLFDPVTRNTLVHCDNLTQTDYDRGLRPQRFHPGEFLEGAVPFSSTEGIYLFKGIGGNAVQVAHGSRSVASVDELDAQALAVARSVFRSRRPAILATYQHRIELESYLGMDFWLAPAEAVATKTLEVTAVSRPNESTWALTLSCRRKERITVSNDFRVLAHERIE